MLFSKKIIIKKIEIPNDLVNLFEYHKQEVEQYDYDRANRVSFSLSSSINTENIKEKIKSIKLEKSFNQKLFEYIDASGYKDSYIYKKANIDRRLFSKLRNEGYHPSRETIIQISIALALSTDELVDLLKSASYSLPTNNYFDIAIRYCFDKKIYDYDAVNEILYSCNLPLLSKREYY